MNEREDAVVQAGVRRQRGNKQVDSDYSDRLTFGVGKPTTVRGVSPLRLPKERAPLRLQEAWKAQCETARSIAEEFGEQKALDYLIGEKFLNFLEAAEHDAEFCAEISAFVAEIKSIFGRWQVEDFFTHPRHLGSIGHFLDDQAHAAFQAVADPAHNFQEGPQRLTLLEWATEFLLDKGP
jgi:hypothetical protein